MIKTKVRDINYNFAIDFLRIVAMIFIFGIHFSQRVEFPGSTLFECGAGAVYIFFTLSGYLAFMSLDKKISSSDYWKKRCRRIFPSYWLLLTLIIFWKMFLNDIPTDPYRVGFLRYYLGLQTVIPSDNYDFWNNMYGLWTMSCFILFYCFAPLFKKWVSSLRRAIFFLPVSMILCEITQFLGKIIFAGINIDKLDVLIGSSPLNNVYAFAIGMTAYYIIKDKKFHVGFILSAILLIISQMIGLPSLIWCTISLLVIIGSEAVFVSQEWIIKPIRFLSKYSFYIYLTHMFAFDIAERISSYLVWGKGFYVIITFVILVILIIFLEGIDRIISRILKKFSKGASQ